jgi:hypothetical protein
MPPAGKSHFLLNFVGACTKSKAHVEARLDGLNQKYKKGSGFQD